MSRISKNTGKLNILRKLKNCFGGTFDHFYSTSIRSLLLGAPYWCGFLILVTPSLRSLHTVMHARHYRRRKWHEWGRNKWGAYTCQTYLMTSYSFRTTMGFVYRKIGQKYIYRFILYSLRLGEGWGRWVKNIRKKIFKSYTSIWNLQH